ncbi:MAG: M61 family metallopeptidase [Deltaproteobacteria bacterium]|nr:M61 family metallopeptidase [Deltaproteobacteria bacterium]
MATAAKSPVRYRVGMGRPHSHLFEVEAHFPAGGEVVEAVLPVWTPGSYLVREYARHLQDVTCSDDRGTPLPVERPDKRTFRVRTGGRPCTFRYRVYAHELTVRTSHLDGTHGYFNGATLFLYQEALRDQPHHVQVDAPAGWNVHVALRREDTSWVAKDYDTLVDSPFEVSPARAHAFTAAGVPHELVTWGDGGQVDAGALCGQLAQVVETQAKLMGGLPHARYLFIVHFTDKGRGGLEHEASTVLLYPRTGLSTQKGREDFLGLASHEYFHLWNVKRIKPKALVPFDYSKESFTTLLWHFEGGTSYFDNLLVRRAGLMPAGAYLSRLGESLTALHGTPGRKVQTVSEASLVAWIKHYRPDENSGNSAISYYLKGEVVCWLLDLHIRKATKDARSLDDVMRLLWSRCGDGRGVPEDGVEAACEQVAGCSLKTFFDASLRTTAELDYSVLSHVGLEARFRPRESASDRGGTPPRAKDKEPKPRGWLGVSLRGSTLASVAADSPAMEAGLYAEDEVVALDGFRVDGAALLSRCEEKAPGETVKVTLFRREALLEVPVALGARPADAAWLARVESPTAQQKAAFKAWCGADWDEA